MRRKVMEHPNGMFLMRDLTNNIIQGEPTNKHDPCLKHFLKSICKCETKQATGILQSTLANRQY